MLETTPSCITTFHHTLLEKLGVRALLDDRGSRISECGPSFPAEVLGLNGSPVAGDDFVVVEHEARAREIVEYRQREIRRKQATAGARGTVEQMLSAIAAGQAEELPVLIKTDVHGSLEAIRTSLERISNPTEKLLMAL